MKTMRTMKHIRKLMILAAMLPVTVWADPTEITSLSSIGTSGDYIITADITVPDNFTSIASFSGTLTAQAKSDGTYPVISGLNKPLFTTCTNATISNIMLKDVHISQSGYVGAICGTANGTTRIYNCGILPTTCTNPDNDAEHPNNRSTVASTDSYCGSLVGLLDGTNSTDNPRVINCFSYANITGGTVRAGIVGYNNYASKIVDDNASGIRTMVMHCMFYGNITQDNNTFYPIYGGLKISNEEKVSNVQSKLNNYNYFLYEAPYSTSIQANNYNCALAAEERFLVRFEFYRYLMNSTRDLAAFYVDPSPTTFKPTGSSNNHKRYDRDLIAKWVLDKAIAPYPILKEPGYYPSVVNYDPTYTFDSETNTRVARTSVTERNNGKNLGTLTVNIGLGTGYPEGATIKSGKSQITLQRTDKDCDDFNFNYDKVQLPYYSEVGTGNCKKNKVVSGWKITGMTGGTQGTFSTSTDAPGYNFADRSTYAKDLYAESGRVFSQGAYFDVPDGVTAITIEPYWGTAAYLSDAYYDCWGYDNDKGIGGFGRRYENGKTYTICGDDQVVYTSLSNALGPLSSNGTVYDNVIVLVGNYHRRQNNHWNETKAFTIMSVDQDEDLEPDYSYIFNSGKQFSHPPIRFDFVNVPGTAMAHKLTSTTYMGIMGNHKWSGWLEVTNTCFIRFSQLEYDNEYKKSGSYPVILLGGVVEQMVSTNGGEESVENTLYLHVGGNAWFKMFNNGCHMDKTRTKTHRIPISVTGGDYEKFYLSGYFRENAPVYSENAECYISGGNFGELAGSGQEKIDGNVDWFINYADIDNFYGGGINDRNPITGNIIVNIKNSHVGTYCGGPKFGDMAATKTVSTIATGCTFGTYFGAGYGGTALVRKNSFNQYQSLNYSWNSSIVSTFTASDGANKRGKYDASYGIAINYEYENFEGSNDKTVGRFYVNYASLSVAQVNDVTSTLTECVVTGNYYGGGSLGEVAGTATSTLTNCTIRGNVFGAGYSVTVPNATVYNGGFSTEPYYNSLTGVFTKGVPSASREFTWEHKDVVNNNATAFDDNNGKLFTQVNFNNFGRVDVNAILTINGGTIGTEGNALTGNVYGGGDQSGVTGNTTVILKGSANVLGNVYGGGNEGPVEGDSKVLIQDQNN